MKKLRVGVVGVGHIGSNHARIYSELPNAEFVALFDIDPARANEIGEKYKVKAAASLNEFAGMVDAASVAAPTSAHFLIARELLARGKHLLIEKPITEKTSDRRLLKKDSSCRSATWNGSIPF
jgi:predicted dehydrogenase